jgi:hypothetical protein
MVPLVVTRVTSPSTISSREQIFCNSAGQAIRVTTVAPTSSGSSLRNRRPPRLRSSVTPWPTRRAPSGPWSSKRRPIWHSNRGATRRSFAWLDADFSKSTKDNHPAGRPSARLGRTSAVQFGSTSLSTWYSEDSGRAGGRYGPRFTKVKTCNWLEALYNRADMIVESSGLRRPIAPLRGARCRAA